MSSGANSLTALPPSVRRRCLLGRLAGGAVLVVCLAVAALVGVLFVGQDARIYGAPTGIRAVGDVLPEAEVVRYTAADGAELPGWFVPASSPATGWTAVLFHGSWGTRADMADEARQLAASGTSVLLAEFRGFGDAAGSPSESGLLQDGAAAADYVRTRPDVDPSRVAYVGYSLGTGVAVDVARSRPPAALVLLAPYTSLPDVAWSELPGLPYRALMRTHLDSLSRIGDVHSPLLVVRGTDDHVIPPEQSMILFDAANQPKRLVTISGADHDLRGPSGPSAVELTIAFLESPATPDG